VDAPRAIDRELLDALSRAAAATPRRRKNHNFHPDDSAACNRLLNAVEPGSYIAPHRHREPGKGESCVVLRGRLGLVLFDDAGRVTRALLAEPGGEVAGLDVPPDTWHTLVSLAPGSVFFEAKAGPYRALAADERAPWAPAEGDPAAADYVARLEALFRR
jgi:cupin fold WbuC family metalloprotein